MIKAVFVIIINGKIKSTPASASNFKSFKMALCAQRAGAVASSARACFKFAETCEFCNSSVALLPREGRVLSLVIFNAFKSCRLEAIYWFLNLTFSHHVRLFSLLLSHLHVGSLAQQLPLVFVPAHFPVIVSLGK